MEKKIKYEMLNGYLCTTPCEHMPVVNVGGSYCTYCKHFVSDDTKTQTVTCNHPNNKPDKEGGKDDNR